jgi:hypothetical protein
LELEEDLEALWSFATADVAGPGLTNTSELG